MLPLPPIAYWHRYNHTKLMHHVTAMGKTLHPAHMTVRVVIVYSPVTTTATSRVRVGIRHSATCTSSHECTYVPQIAAISHRIMQQFYTTHIRVNIVPQGYPRAPKPRIERARCNKPSIWFIVGRHHKHAQKWLPPHCIRHNDGRSSLGACHTATIPVITLKICLLYTSPSPRDLSTSRMPSSA